MGSKAVVMGEGKTKPSDAELVARAQRGEIEAYAELYQRHVDAIYRYIRSRLASQEDAEDLTENVFLQAFQALGRYQERGHPYSAYLYQVARNQLVDHYRQRREQVPLDSLPATVDGSEPLEAEAERQQELERILEALAGLPQGYQEVIRLRLLLDLPTPTVAQWMGRSEGAVRVLLYRALRKLRKKLEDDNEA